MVTAILPEPLQDRHRCREAVPTVLPAEAPRVSAAHGVAGPAPPALPPGRVGLPLAPRSAVPAEATLRTARGARRTRPAGRSEAPTQDPAPSRPRARRRRQPPSCSWQPVADRTSSGRSRSAPARQGDHHPVRPLRAAARLVGGPRVLDRSGRTSILRFHSRSPAGRFPQRHQRISSGAVTPRIANPDDNTNFVA